MLIFPQMFEFGLSLQNLTNEADRSTGNSIYSLFADVGGVQVYEYGDCMPRTVVILCL